MSDDKGIAEVAAAPENTLSPVVAEGSGKTAQIEGAQAKTVHNAELYAATQESKINQFSAASMHLYFCVFVAFCCACANGYDGSLMGGLLGMPYFQDKFPIGTAGSQVSLVGSLYNVGSIVTAPVGAIICDRWGRRVGMFSGAWVIIIGAIVTSTSNTLAQLIVGRFILGVGIQIMTVGAPAYAIEIAPPHWRGRCAGLYNNGWFGGSIPAALIIFGTAYIENDYSWRIPLILQCFTCLIVICSVWFIPESPRWQMANGHGDLAIEFLVKYHGNGDPNSRLVRLEVEEMREGIKTDSYDKTWWDYRPLFMTHNGRWRFAQVLMISIFGQWSGNGLGYFNVKIFQDIGITTTAQLLGYNVLASVTQAIGGVSGAALTDRMPRRPVLVIGTFLAAIALACNAGTTAVLNNEQDATGVMTSVSFEKGALATYFLFQTIYGFTYTPLQGVIPAEALDTNLRAKGLAASGFIVGCIGFINTYASPIANANIGYKYIYVFVGWDIFESLMWYLFCVESQGRTLEELEYVYQQPNPVKASLRMDKIIVQQDGTVTEKVAADVPV